MQIFLDWVNAHPQWAGLVIFLVAASESLVLVGILVPGIVFMLGVGALIGLGALDFWSCFFWAAAGAIVGDGFSYWLGMHYHKQIQAMWPLSRYPDLVPRGERFFRKHGGKSVFFGRFVGPIRAIIPAVAGIMEMPPLRFYLVNVLSALVWAPVVLLPGIVFGTSIEAASGASTRIVILFIIVAALFWLFAVLARRLVGYICARAGLSELRVYAAISVLLVAVFVASGLIVRDKMQSLGPRLVLEEQQAQRWWEGEWQQRPVEIPRSVISRGRSLTIQWFSKAEDITKLLIQKGWQTPVPLLYANTFLWLVPDIELERQPVMPRYYSWKLPALSYIRPYDDNGGLLILRLWGVESDSRSLWTGYVSHAQPSERLGLLYYPVEIDDDGRDLQRLIQYSLADAANHDTRYKVVSRAQPDKVFHDTSHTPDEALLLLETAVDQEP